jgi:photosystem II stability/assembly factor-like uncharacterized protein
MSGRDVHDHLRDKHLQDELNRLVPAMPPEGEWPHVLARVGSEVTEASTVATRRASDETGTTSSRAAAEAAGTRPSEWHLVSRDGRHRSAFAYAAISFAVLVLLAGLGTGIFEAVTHLGKDTPVVVITDDTLGPATTGQTTQTTQKSTVSDGTWQQVPLSVDGGSVSVLVTDPTDPAVLYATTDQGPYKSTDGGVTWTPVSAEQSARMIVVDPGSPSTVYRIISGSGGGVESALTGGDGALYKSLDGGSTWTKVSERPGYPDFQMWPWWQLLIDPSTTPSTLYGVCPVYWASPGTRLFKSTDGGHSWQDLTDELPWQSREVRQLTIDASRHMLYLTASDSLLRSFDGGATWEDLSAGIPAGVGSASVPGSLSDLAVFLDPRDPSRLYLYRTGDPATFYESSDAAQTWSELTGAELDWAKAVSVAAPRTPVAAIEANTAFLTGLTGTVTDASNGLEVTVFLGADGLVSQEPRGVVIDPVDPSILSVATQRGVYRSVDGGATWNQSSAGMTNTQIGKVVVDPVTPSTIYATTPVGIRKSTDGGASWTTILAATGDSSLVIAPSSPSTLYAWTSTGLQRSDDGGATWAQRDRPGPPELEGWSWGWVEPAPLPGLVLVASNAPDTLYALGGDSGLGRSTDGGNTWYKVAGLPGPDIAEIGGLVEAPGDPSTLYAGVLGNGIYTSTDGGRTWARLGYSRSSVESLAVALGDPVTIWATGEGAPIYRSTDAGETWTEVTPPDGQPGSLLADPRSSGTLYTVSFSDVGGSEPHAKFWRSLDGGDTWAVFADELPVGSGTMVLDPAPGGALYFASERGLYRLVPAGG